MITNSSTSLVDDPQDIFNHCFDYVQTMVNSRMEGNYEWLLDEGAKSSLRFNQSVGFILIILHLTPWGDLFLNVG